VSLLNEAVDLRLYRWTIINDNEKSDKRNRYKHRCIRGYAGTPSATTLRYLRMPNDYTNRLDNSQPVCTHRIISAIFIKAMGGIRRVDS
jgi:hypothetical protein